MKIKGIFKKTIFRNEENLYTVALFLIKETIEKSLEETSKTITVVGLFPEINMDDSYILLGDITKTKYGKQLQVTEYEICPKETKNEIINFLSSDLFKGVGVKLATSIYNYFKENTINLILENPNDLLKISGITKAKATTIYETLREYSASHEIITYLNKLGFSVNIGVSIYNTYKSETIKVIEEDIYNILEKVKTINFLDLDKLALKNNIEENDPRRIKALILYIMKNDSNESGNTCINFDTIYKNINKLLFDNIPVEKVQFYLDTLNKEFKVIKQEDLYFLKEIYEAQMNICRRLDLLTNIKTPKQLTTKDLDYAEQLFNITYSPKQKEAIISSLNNKLTVITGGPGTGKTTLVKAITLLYKHNYDNKMTLLAPTGRASKRLNETTLMNASTIHRFLKWNKDTNQFSVNQYNKDNSKFLVIDEFSMVDTLLFDSLLKAIDDDIHIVLVGDYHQLPSVGPGQLLKDIIESGKINTIKLDTIYRQSDNSYINTLSSIVKNKNIENLSLSKKEDFNFIETPNIDTTIVNVCQKALEKNIDCDNIQILAPMYAGIGGIDNLNDKLREIYNKQDGNKNEIITDNVIYRENDKVIQLTNNIDDNVFNGDIGYIKVIYSAKYSASKKDEVHIDFDGNIVCYYNKDLINIKHAYAISIHKAQGSEFNHVIIPLSFSHKRMLYNHLMYTGITRAKKSLILTGDSQMLKYAIDNDFDSNRKTNFKNLLIEKIK